jgi:hypothetical protein
MEKLGWRSGGHSSVWRRRSRLGRVGFWLALVAAGPATAGAQDLAPAPPVPIPDPVPPPPAPLFDASPPLVVDPTAPVPSHLTVGSQQFDASVAGLRAYVNGLKSTNPRLFAQLAPDVDRLESKVQTAWTVAGIGVGLGLASILYGVLGQKHCSLPTLSDPNFASKTAAFGSCNDDNTRTLMTLGLLGGGAMLAGGIGAVVVAPKRSDLLEVVNKHNRLNAEPLRLQLGYDPSQRFAYGAATVPF